jgi:hypothetical protein
VFSLFQYTLNLEPCPKQAVLNRSKYRYIAVAMMVENPVQQRLFDKLTAQAKRR